MIDERNETIKALEKLVHEKDDAVFSQTRMIDERDETIKALEKLVHEKDASEAHREVIQRGSPFFSR